MASDDYQQACYAAVQANMITFKLKHGENGDSSNHESSDDSCGNGDGSSSFDQCTVHAIVHPDGDMQPEHIATLRMTAIAESQVNKPTFRYQISKTTEEMEPLVYDLLSFQGEFRSDIFGRGSQYEGSGVWGDEFGRGLLVAIEHFEVKHSLRGMGIGTKLINQVLDWVHKKAGELGECAQDCSYLVVAPASLRVDVVREFGQENYYTGDWGVRQAEVAAFKEKQAEKSIAFWRKQGFRRVGLSGFWGYATDSKHPSRRLTAEEDSKRDHIDPPRLNAY